jgi:hypothetical protein
VRRARAWVLAPLRVLAIALPRCGGDDDASGNQQVSGRSMSMSDGDGTPVPHFMKG